MKDPIYKFLQVITFILFVLMSFLVFIQVILRYFFSSPIAWSDEAARLLMIWVSFLGIALAFFHGAHPAITFVIGKFRGKTKRIYELVIDILLLVSFAAITIYGVQLCVSTHRFASTILRYPMSLQYSALPVSMSFMCYKIIRDMIAMALPKREEEG